ncbi:hypothetical protein [Streptomyces sp. NPDC001380]|uniref:hypothetical protein n=1 Tax=Streptomyces sp. NPDC001380 TaxID=3364566 RepID=UPI00367FB21D
MLDPSPGRPPAKDRANARVQRHPPWALGCLVEEIVGAIVGAISRGIAWLIFGLIGDVLFEGFVKAMKRAFRALRPRRTTRALKVSLEKQ